MKNFSRELTDKLLIIDNNENTKRRYHRKADITTVKTFIHMIRHNQVDLSNTGHRQMYYKCIKLGYIDEDMNILKEVK